MGDQGRLQELCRVSMRCSSWGVGSHATEKHGQGPEGGERLELWQLEAGGKSRQGQGMGASGPEKRTDSPCVPGRALEGRESGADAVGLLPEKTSLLFVEWVGPARGCGDLRKTGPASWWRLSLRNILPPESPPSSWGSRQCLHPAERIQPVRTRRGGVGNRADRGPERSGYLHFFIKK